MRHLRSAAVLLSLLAAAAPARAQDQEQMKQNLAKKLEGEFLKKASWVTEYPKALADAKKGNKLIFAFFTRSYAR